MLKEEMDYFLRYYNDKISIINSTIVTIESRPSTAFNKGSIALLNRLRWSFEMVLQKAKSTFDKIEPTSSVDDWSSESFDSESPSDED